MKFLSKLADPLVGEKLLDRLDNLTYFVKDDFGRYVSINQTLVDRCGVPDKSALVGRTAVDVFEKPLGEYFFRQDIKLIQSGQPLINEMEQHPYPRRQTGWCLTTKLPLVDRRGVTVGLVGMSRDLESPDQDASLLQSISKILQHIKMHLADALRTSELSQSAGLSAWQLDQRMRSLFGCTTAQLILQFRMDAAAKRLRSSDDSIISVALSVGYRNQSAFSRQFRKTFGMPPIEYRSHR
ncbi:MAG: AraC family transcriptional regulator [Planctomycetota bacterium]